MRRLTLLLAVCLILCGCTPTATPTEPIETTTVLPQQPTETSAPATEPLPPESTAPVTAPPETTLPATEPAPDSYTVTISDPDTPIYEGPGFRYACTALVEEKGVYTIVAEETDSDGNLWGKLKSGIGWICLTDPPICPVFVQYAPAHFAAATSWHCGETEYVTDIGILANETVTNLTVSLLNWEDTYIEEDLLYTQEIMHADAPLLISVVFYGDLTTYGLRFTDARGAERCYALYISGKDGSLICSEYTP